MKLKLIPIVIAAIAMSVAPLTANAQTTNPQGRQRPPKMERAFSQLNLSESQQAELRRIHEEKKTQMENILTQEQRNSIESARSSGEHPRRAFGSLNLTSEQRERMREIMESAREESHNVLTDAQRQQLEQMRQQREPRGPRRENTQR
ncbi:MAG: Spy/CpxP family protein refolding chaperone [Oscillatoria sp. PMC 1068.18]|nr:Spy/CpxP family protein refolding chaperone [Oscillatoria sp. PMC 1076.18]MEC4990506.1 Spy/CpxP family protein refolding chaperone [Oscillatoria sp. PMC 1068.18]